MTEPMLLASGSLRGKPAVFATRRQPPHRLPFEFRMWTAEAYAGFLAEIGHLYKRATYGSAEATREVRKRDGEAAWLRARARAMARESGAPEGIAEVVEAALQPLEQLSPLDRSKLRAKATKKAKQPRKIVGGDRPVIVRAPGEPRQSRDTGDKTPLPPGLSAAADAEIRTRGSVIVINQHREAEKALAAMRKLVPSLARPITAAARPRPSRRRGGHLTVRPRPGVDPSEWEVTTASGKPARGVHVAPDCSVVPAGTRLGAQDSVALRSIERLARAVEKLANR